MREIFSTREVPHEGPAALRHVVAYCSAQDGIGSLKGVEDGALRGWTINLEPYLSLEAR